MTIDGPHEREARILERLKDQQNIIQLVAPRTQIDIPVTDVATGLEVRFPLEFFALEWAESSLEAIVANGGANARTMIQQFGDVCKGVQRLHARSIAHRDLKPANCLILGNGSVVLGDFGTARDYADNTPPLRLKYETPVGDVWYTGLELLCGLGDDPALAFASDFFALGAILFELVTLNPLAPYLYRDAGDFARHLLAVPEASRRAVFDGTVGAVAQAWKLPDIEDFPTTVPAVIRGRLNSLYQTLARLDYRDRPVNFTAVFRELDICRRMLEYEAAYQRYLELKRRRRENRLQKLERRDKV